MSTCEFSEQTKEFEVRIRNEMKAAQDAALNELGARVDQVRDAFSRSDFERLAGVEQMKRTFLCRDWVTEEIQAYSSKQDTRLAKLCAELEDFASRLSGLDIKIEAQHGNIEVTAKREAHSVLDTIRADECGRLARLEGTLAEIDKRYDLVQKSISQELERLGKETSATTERRIGELV